MAEESNNASEHPVHFHDTGDVTLKLKGALFRVHKERLCQRSEVFKDMFGLPYLGTSDEPPEGTSESCIILHDNPEEFAILLDLIYEYSVDFGYTKQCLQLALLGHKYEVPLVTSSTRGYLESDLPTGVGSRDFWIAQKYREDASMVPLVLRVSKLLEIPAVAPWAMYMLVIQQTEPNAEWPLQTEEDEILLKSLDEQIRAIRALNQLTIKSWNQSVARFMKRPCYTEWWDDEDGCWRRSELMDLEDSGFMLEADAQDPLRDMYDTMEFCCEGLCSLCGDAWTYCAGVLMERLLESIKLHL